MSEDELKELARRRKAREIAFTEARGMLKGASFAQLSDTEKGFLKLCELIVNGFGPVMDTIDDLQERVIRLTQRIEGLEKRLDKIEKFQHTLEENR